MKNRWLAIISIVLALAATIGLVLYFYQRPMPSSTETQNTPTPAGKPQVNEPQKEPVAYPVKVHFSKHPDSDEDPAKTFPLSRTSPTSGVAAYAISQLIAGPTASEVAQGYFSNVRVRNDASSCGNNDFSLSIKDGVATLQFCRTFDAIGTIADGQADQTIQATLKQFPAIKKVVILAKDGHCQFDLSGEDHCKQ